MERDFRITQLAQECLRAGMTRRELIKFAAAAGLGASLFGHLSSSRAAEPQRGGRVVAALSNSSVSDSLDPAKGSNSGDYIRQYLFYDGLTQLDEQMLAQPGLATSFESEDGRVWTFKLRDHVQFHDGKTFSSEDVVFSLARHKEESTASTVKSLADDMENIEATGPLEVRITLKQPNIDFPTVLGTPQFLILAKDTTDFSVPNGTGPYRCKEFVPGGRTVGVRNENFWKEGKPYLDEIELIGLTDGAARVNGLLAGNIDVIATLDVRDLKRLEATGRHKIMETESGLYTNLILRQDMNPTDNIELSHAIKYLHDREYLRDRVMQGHALIANDHPVPAWHPYHLDDLPQRTLDLDKARHHIKKGGLEGISLDIVTTPNLQGAIDGAQMLQQNAQKVGIELNVRRVPYDGYWSTHWMKHPISYGSINPRPTLDMLFTQFYKSDSKWNESAWKHEQFDELVDAARGELDDARRKQMYGDMQALVQEHCSVIIPMFVSFLDAYDSRIQNMTPNPAGMLKGYRFAEDIWLDT